jgi:hypothetical protein
MSAHFCDGCGDGHDWRDCPDVEESIFEHDPEWEAEEVPPPMVGDIPVTVYVDPENAQAYADAGYRVWTPPHRPPVDPSEPRVGQGLSPRGTDAVLWTEHGKWLISRRF